MNLQKLFDMQRTLDARIVKEHGLEGQELLPQKILALQVELGECANEWRGFKFWSKDQTPRTSIHVIPSKTAFADHKNPLLEEYIDCLHFILSIGLEISSKYYMISYGGVNDSVEYAKDYYKDAKPLQAFKKLFTEIANLSVRMSDSSYHNVVIGFVAVGIALGFTEEQIEEAYMNKNKVNHERQDTNY